MSGLRFQKAETFLFCNGKSCLIKNVRIASSFIIYSNVQICLQVGVLMSAQTSIEVVYTILTMENRLGY